MEELLNNVIDNIKEGVIVIDSNFMFTYANKAAKTIGLDSELIIGKNLFEVFPNLQKKNSTFSHVFETKKPLLDQEQTFITYRGERRTTVTSTYPVVKNEEVIGAFETFQDISMLYTLSDQLRNLQLKQKKEKQTNQSLMEVQKDYPDFIGEDPAILKIKSQIDLIASSPSPIFIYGETGTGKEVLIHAIHQASKFKIPLIAQNCAAIPENLLESYLFGTTKGSFTGAMDREGLFEIADGGILFLDEINSLPKSLQAKLLRVLQENKIRRVGDTKEISVNVRIIAATNVSPKKLVIDKELREDLYYRLNVLNIELPPLRERKNDIPHLIVHFINYFNHLFGKDILGVTDKALYLLKNYKWPGNIRELKNTIERIMNMKNTGYIAESNIQFQNFLQVSSEIGEFNNTSLRKDQTFKEIIQKTEISIIKQELRNTSGNISQASRNLDMPQQTLNNKIQKYNLKKYILTMKLLNNE